MSYVRHPIIIGLLGVVFIAPWLTGCFGADVSDAKPTFGREPQVAEFPSANETVRGEDDPPIVTLELGSALHEHRLSAGDDLPGNIIIPTTNLNAVPVTAALQAVLAGTDISLSWDTGTLGDRLVTVVNLSGSLPKVVKQVCSSAKVFCNYRHGTLELVDKDTFIVGLPPLAKVGAAASSANSMVEAINQLSGAKAQTDEQGGNVIYTTDVEGQEKVHLYLEQLRNGRPLVVLQLYVWEVTLSKDNGEGIQWNQFNLSDLGPGYAKLALKGLTNANTFANTSGSVSLGAVTAGRLNTSSLFTFLGTQGRVQTISSPQITFISGTAATFKVGGKQRYISQVGAQSNNASGTAGTNTSTSTINTDSIDTGLTVDVSGSYENGIVLANLDLTLSNLVDLHATTTNGITIDLPETSDEKINTNMRVRPGDNLVLAGLVRSADNNNRQGIPIGGMSIPTYADDTVQNRELVVVVKPSVVLFSDAGAVAEIKKREDAPSLPGPVLISKDGAQSIAMPASGATVSSATPDVMPAKPELMVPAPKAIVEQPVALAPSNDGAPVDRLLMQKGFSHAFDELQQPAAPVALKTEARP